MFDVPVMVLKSAISASRNVVVSFTSTATDSFSSSHPLCRFLDGIMISCPAHFISVPNCVRMFHPRNNGSTTPGRINRLMVSCLLPNLTSTSSCALIPPHHPSANLTCRLALVILPRAARVYTSSSLTRLAVAPVSIVAL